MHKLKTAAGLWTILQTQPNSNIREINQWARDTFGSSEVAWPPRWMYLSGDNYGFLFEEDAMLFSLRWL